MTMTISMTERDGAEGAGVPPSPLAAPGLAESHGAAVADLGIFAPQVIDPVPLPERLHFVSPRALASALRIARFAVTRRAA